MLNFWSLPRVLPNPSLKLSPNGGLRGPSRRYAVHFRQPGPRVPPSGQLSSNVMRVGARQHLAARVRQVEPMPRVRLGMVLDNQFVELQFMQQAFQPAHAALEGAHARVIGQHCQCVHKRALALGQFAQAATELVKMHTQALHAVRAR